MGKKKAVSGLDDSRFSRIKSDPLFAGLKNTEKKVVIDKRFAAALTDERFSTRSKVDMRGRVQKKSVGNAMLDLYELEEDEKEKKVTKKKDSKEIEEFFDEDGDVEEEEGSDESDQDEEESSQVFKKLDLARGEGNIESSSDDDSSDEEEEEKEEEWEKSKESMQIELDLAHLDKDADDVEWTSKRLAVCNLEWDHVNCEDILMLVKSFTPEGGFVKTVGIYMSDFGKEQLELEQKNGPPVKLSKPIEEYEEDEMDPETKNAVRNYLLGRLKYFYAVIEFDSIESASAVYEECDGYQFEDTGLKMDLRFIPDEMTFEEDRVREVLNAEELNTRKYKPKKKPKNSIASTSTKIAWDEDDPSRSKKLLDAFDGNDQAAKDLIVGSDEEEEEGNTDEEKRNALLSLLSTEEKATKLDVEWSGDEKSEANHDGNSSDSDGEYMKIEDDADEIGISSATQKKEEVEEEKLSGYKAFRKKKKAKLAESKLKKMNGQKDTNIKEAEMVETVVKDDRFKALFTDSEFAIEPSSKKFKGSLLASKQAEKRSERNEQTADVDKKEEDLVSKLKRKTNKWKK